MIFQIYWYQIFYLKEFINCIKVYDLKKMDYLKNHCFRYKAILVFSVESKIKTKSVSIQTEWVYTKLIGQLCN